METLVVLDYFDNSVNIYKGKIPENIDSIKLLEELGHKASECAWMFCEILKLIYINIH